VLQTVATTASQPFYIVYSKESGAESLWEDADARLVELFEHPITETQAA
jgi:hypothetical protein